ncbi:MAG: T9SS type A sorting domain-containing protein, partial [Ferruginibacter sp.]
SSTSPIQLSWNGADDTGGSGIRSYTLYVSTDGTNYSIVSTGITRTDTTFVGTLGATYCFFVLATDTVGNMEILNQSEITCTSIGGVVPVTMLYFRGKTIDNNNILEWETQNEINARSYSLMRSFDGFNFEEINTTTARGNRGGTYSYRDRNIDRFQSNVFFYKLKQIDNDGRSSLSNVVRLTHNKGSIPSIIYPNPTKGIITVSIGDTKLIGTNIEVLDISGRKLQTVKLVSLTQNVDLTNYVNGTYIFKLNNNEILKVIKQ